jgi:hypothetical protein
LGYKLDKKGNVIKSPPDPARDAITANSLKKSSSTYRKAALLGNTYTKAPKNVSKKGKKILKVPTPKFPPKGKDAGK